MEQEEINDGNRLIAYFVMGAKCFPENIHTAEELKYNSSWNWLMPVISKIESLEHDTVIDFRYNPHSKRKDKMHYWSQIGKDTIADDISGSSYESKINATWECCVKFIKWYNQQSK
jgi:hypothetical protein